ncbi:MAG: alpha/beta hydrolase [Salinarimonadaceae bacterium]|nr:MAG: alpha/beta hydrolase [Salinarimonadaceae bacterium]
MTAQIHETLGFRHALAPGVDPSRAPILLLHGTGGDETDLLPLGAQVAPGTTLIAPRGAVSENGMPRFFRRLAEGVFDEEDVSRRAADLARFVAEAREAYGLAAPIALGFSNGANIAAALLWEHPDVLAGAVLLRAMRPLAREPVGGLDGKRVLIANGAVDPLIPADRSAAFAATLEKAGASVTLEILPAGHGLTQADLALASRHLADG